MRDRKKKTGAKYRAALGIFAGAALLALTAGCRIGQDIEPESVIMDGKGGQNAQEEEIDGAEERLQVMASFYTMADFAEKIEIGRAHV